MSMNNVEGIEGLYIGGMFVLRSKQAMKEAGITHVLSALRMGGNNQEDLFKNYKHLTIPVDDVEDENLLSHLPEACRFIEDGLKEGAVLVHCAVGKSRSATCVIAYMMATLHLTPDKALAQLRQTRPFVEPNPGFWDQLKRYHAMGCPQTSLDDYPAYQRWAYEREVALSVACGRAPETLRFADEAEKSLPESSSGSESELRCRKCRRVLATSTFMAVHEPPGAKTEEATEDFLLNNFSPNPDQFKPLDSDPSKPEKIESPSSTSSKACAHFFVHPLLWMKSALELGELEGRLNCPNQKCGQNVGKYAWQGMPCSCGTWVTPAFSIGKSRVDEVKVGKLRMKKGQPMGVEVRSPASSSTEVVIPLEEGSPDSVEKKRDENL